MAKQLSVPIHLYIMNPRFVGLIVRANSLASVRDLGTVVQSIVSLAKSLVKDSLSLTVCTIKLIAVIFFAEKL